MAIIGAYDMKRTSIKDIIDNLPNYDNEWMKYLEYLDNIQDTTLQECYIHSYCNYIDLHIIDDLRNSKLANKPLHYKVVKDFVKNHSNAIVNTYLVVDDYPCPCPRLCHSVHTDKISRYGIEATYLSYDKENRCFDYESTKNLYFDMPINPYDIAKEYKAQMELNRSFTEKFEADYDKYQEEFNSHPDIGLRRVYVNIK